MIYSAFLVSTQLVQFSGSLTYDSNGFAVLPSYTITPVVASLQPLSSRNLQFKPEGTHVADYYEFLTDFLVDSDSLLSSLGNYFIYNNNLVYKIISSQNFLPFSSLSVAHAEGIMVRDNRLTFNGTILSLPLPQIDGEYAPLFELIAMVNSCFLSPNTITTMWAFQQELQPIFPYCAVSIETVENTDNTNYVGFDSTRTTQYTNISKQLVVKFSFFSQDQIQALNLMEQFKLNYNNYTFNTNQFAFIGFYEEPNGVEKDFYEDRTIFHADIRMRFSWIVQESQSSTQTIETTAFTLSIST